MNTTKKMLAAAVAVATAAVAAVPAHAEIELGEGLSVTGFVDMSFVYTDIDDSSSTQVFAVDQVETTFLYAGKDGVSAQVDIEYSQDQNGDATTFVEQAFITKMLSDNLSVKGGRFLSYSGWETEEPTGLYQYSGAGYGGLFYGGYQQGVSAYYDTDMFDFMFSALNSAFDPVDNDNSKVAIETGVALTPAEGLTAKLFYISDDETDLINFWTSYEVASWTFAFEYNVGEYGVVDLSNLDDGLAGFGDAEADGFLLMANYAWDKLGLTLRYHDYAVDVGSDTVLEKSAITLAPSYAVSDNLLIVTELRLDEATFGGVDGADTTAVAIEALFTF